MSNTKSIPKDPKDYMFEQIVQGQEIFKDPVYQTAFLKGVEYQKMINEQENEYRGS